MEEGIDQGQARIKLKLDVNPTLFEEDSFAYVPFVPNATKMPIENSLTIGSLVVVLMQVAKTSREKVFQCCANSTMLLHVTSGVT
jgi:hypothetical protein